MHKMCNNIFGRTILILSSVLFMTAVSSCVTTPPAGPQSAVSNSKPMYYGTGRGESALTAMTAARRSAVVQAAVDLLGRASSSSTASDVELVLSGISDLSPYVYMDSQLTVDSRSGDGFYYLLGIRINLKVLADKLISENILGGQVDGSSDVSYSLEDQDIPDKTTVPALSEKESGKSRGTAEDSTVEAVVSDLTAAELEIISRYIDNLTYMVYYNEEAASDPGLTRSAVISANRFLDDGGWEWVELRAIEKIEEEQAEVYEQETGNAVSLIQWIAHKMNADVYIEVSLEASSTVEGGRYFGNADVSLSFYNALTAEEFGKTVFSSDKTVSNSVSAEEAMLKAAAMAVVGGMEAAVAEAEERIAIAASHGFKYNLTIKNTSDPEIMRVFEKKLGQKAKSVKRISFSAEESIFEVYLIGDIADLEDLVYHTAKSIPGLEEGMLVMQRRNSIIFDSGM